MATDQLIADDETIEAVDPAALEPGDAVIVDSVTSDAPPTRGTVETIHNEVGRIGVEMARDDGQTVVAWEQQGRTYSRVGGATDE